MSQPIERTVTFDSPVGRRGYNVVRFRIEPPIQVHSPKFLEEAVRATPGNTHAFGDFDLIDGVDIDFTDKAGTYGKMRVNPSAQKDQFEQFVTKAFTPELELGNVALHFSFPEEQ